MKFLTMLILGATLLFGAVDINNASKQELMTLNGVGEKKADSIIEHRKGNCFEKIDGITKVKGIGAKFLEKNKKNMKVGKCKSNS